MAFVKFRVKLAVNSSRETSEGSNRVSDRKEKLRSEGQRQVTALATYGTQTSMLTLSAQTSQMVALAASFSCIYRVP